MKQRKKIKGAVKRAIVDEAGGKCANPGCLNWRTHIHHIKHWAVYQSDAPEILIAVCPSCHDAIHHSRLQIQDATVESWKSIDRTTFERLAYLTVEPSTILKLLTGTVAVATKNDLVSLFELSTECRLSFRVHDKDILLVDLRISDAKGQPQIKVADNFVRTQKEGLSFDHVPGRVRIEAPATEQFVPEWLGKLLEEDNPTLSDHKTIVLLDLHVLEPGLLQVQGLWIYGDTAVFITDDKLMFAHPGMKKPLGIIGDGKDSVLLYAGDQHVPLFGFSDRSALRIPTQGSK